MGARASDNPLASVALVLGILSLCGGALAPIGLICAAIALRRAKYRYGAGMVQARSGMVLSLIGLVVTAPLLILMLKFNEITGVSL